MSNKEKITKLLSNGVNILDPESVYIDETVEIENDVIIGPNTQIKGSSVIKSGTVIEGTAYIVDSTIDNALIKFSCRIEDSQIDSGSAVGPFANIRLGSHLGKDTKIGNFVETKKTSLADGAKANHLTYLGDAEVGENTNIGAGTITCNYDGKNKSKTKIGANVFIGSNSSLVAPVEIEDGATVGAGSTIRKNVEKDDLALTRGELVVKKDWSKEKRKD